MVTFDVTSPAGVMSETVNSGPSEPPFQVEDEVHLHAGLDRADLVCRGRRREAR